MERMTYEGALQQFFPYVSKIGDQAKIFKSYPVRVRTQKKISYYEVGASNITENGEIVISENTTIRESANITAFEKLYLRPGDIILPHRSKKLHLGLYMDSPLPFIPNSSLIVIRSGSVENGRYLLACLQLPFIKSYIESYMIDKRGDTTVFDLEKLQTLTIPVATKKTKTAIFEVDRYTSYAKRASKLHKKLENITIQLLAEAIAGEYESLDDMFFEYMDEHLKKIEGIVDSVEASFIHSSAIDLLRSDFVEYMKNELL